MGRMFAPRPSRIALLAGLVACSEPVDVAFRMPQDGSLIVNRTATSVSRTPLGPESIAIKWTKRIDVLGGGRIGIDTLHWQEAWTRYEVSVENPDGELTWSMAPDEKGVVAPIPPELAPLGPHPPREIWIAPDRTARVRWLPWPEPPPPPDAKPPPKKPVEVAATPEEPPLPPPPPPEPMPLTLQELDNFFAGLVLAPSEPVKPGFAWKWTVAERVTRGGEVSTTSTWTFDRAQGSEAVLIETLTLADSMAPADGQFRTSALTGSGEMRLDLATGLPTSYASAYEADLASPSARGTSSMRVETKFRYKPPGG